MGLVHFLLVYDLRQRRLIDVQEFTDAREATDAYGCAEMAHLDDRDTEIVLVGSDSIETVRNDARPLLHCRRGDHPAGARGYVGTAVPGWSQQRPAP